MSAHTPGPWRAVITAGSIPYVESEAGDYIADVQSTTDDAHLIAAAPKMLETLKRIIDRAESGDEEDHFSETFGEDFDDARAAITKAEGGA